MVMPPPLVLLFSSSSDQADIVIVVNTPAIASHITERTIFFIPNLFLSYLQNCAAKLMKKGETEKKKRENTVQNGKK